jgi:hypothetical protein
MNTYNQLVTEMASSLITNKANQPFLSTTKSNNASKLPRIGKLAAMILIITFASFHAQAAKMLFRSNFGSGVSVSAPTNFFPNGYGALQSLTGIDSETGYSWPTKAFGSNFSGMLLITKDPVTSATIGDYITNEVRTVSGPKGKMVNELFQNVKIKGDVGQASSQSAFMINRSSKIGDINDFYMTYWIKYPADLAEKLDPTVSSGNWRYHFSFKTGGYNGNDSSGDYRISISIQKGIDGKLHWLTMGDSDANGPVPKTTYWYERNHIVPVPVGEWLKFEVYSHRSAGSDGRFWAAMNGQEIIDYQGPTMGVYNLPITRLIAHSAYSGGYGPVESHITGLEIWDGFPCGSGVSCYDFDKVAPTVPASPKATLRKYSTFASTALSWTASTDAVGVSGYAIYRNGIKVGVSTTPSYTDKITGSAKGTLYSYTVKAFDAAENFSNSSSAVNVTY